MMSTHVLKVFQRHTIYSLSKQSSKPHVFYVGTHVEIHEFYHCTPVVKFHVLLTVHLDIIV